MWRVASDRICHARLGWSVAVISRPAARSARPPSSEAGTQGVSRVLADPGSEHVELDRQWIARRWWWWRWRQETRCEEVHFARLPLCPTPLRWLCADLHHRTNSLQRVFASSLSFPSNQQVDCVPTFFFDQCTFHVERNRRSGRWTQIQPYRIERPAILMREPRMRQTGDLQSVTKLNARHLRSLTIIHSSSLAMTMLRSMEHPEHAAARIHGDDCWSE
jgi:hypothetical protein